MNYDLVVEILLKQHQQRFRTEPPYCDYLDIVKARDKVFERFQSEFREPELVSELTFRDFLRFEHNCHWTGLQRPSKHACDDMPKLRRALAFLFDEAVGVEKRLDSLTSDDNHSVRGIALGILTPLLLVMYPDRYGVWNAKSEAAMKALKIWPQFNRGTSKGERYAVLNQLYCELSNRLEVDLWSLDGLWHVINEISRRETDSAFLLAELEEKKYVEGRRSEQTSVRIERNARARNDCIKFQGLDCMVCGFNFFEVYGEIGLGYIHVHHIEDLAFGSENQQVDPKKDLVPVCPNCHAMLHKAVSKARSVDELSQLIMRIRKHHNC